jgi:hypothetical protein
VLALVHRLMPDKPESAARTQRLLGLAGLLALGGTGTFAVIGIILVTVWPQREGPDIADALTALATIAAAAIGAVAGWLARGYTISAPDAPVPAPVAPGTR